MGLTGSAHLISGNTETISDILAFLEQQGIATVANPDLYVRTYSHFGIDEAQNALLKTLEEPPAGSIFFIIVQSPETLLPTLRSRMQTLVLSGADVAGLVDANIFLSATPAKRLDMLKPLLEKGDDDRRDIGGIIAFLASLERALAKHPEGLAAIYRARKYMSDKGALVKPLLEQVALLTPKV